MGNLSFFTTEEQIYELFGRVGDVKRIVMGLDRNDKTPCGFCFVEYVLPSLLLLLAAARFSDDADERERLTLFFLLDRYFSHDDALSSLRYISGTKLDERIIRADIDPGYQENRQYGRGVLRSLILSHSCPFLLISFPCVALAQPGKSGGQIRDEYREEFDAGRYKADPSELAAAAAVGDEV